MHSHLPDTHPDGTLPRRVEYRSPIKSGEPLTIRYEQHDDVVRMHFVVGDDVRAAAAAQAITVWANRRYADHHGTKVRNARKHEENPCSGRLMQVALCRGGARYGCIPCAGDGGRRRKVVFGDIRRGGQGGGRRTGRCNKASILIPTCAMIWL